MFKIYQLLLINLLMVQGIGCSLQQEFKQYLDANNISFKLIVIKKKTQNVQQPLNSKNSSAELALVNKKILDQDTTQKNYIPQSETHFIIRNKINEKNKTTYNYEIQNKIIDLIIKQKPRNIKIAMYDLNDPHIISVLKFVAEKDAKVEILLDNSQKQNNSINILKENENIDIFYAPKKIFQNENNGLMHSKFLILDNQLILGSYNLTKASAFHCEDLIILNNNNYSEIIDSYVINFNNLKLLIESAEKRSLNCLDLDWRNKQDFKKDSYINEKKDICLFSQTHNIESAIIQFIKNEQTSIKIAIYTFTNDKIAHELNAAHDRGISIDILIDQGQYNSIPSMKSISDSLKKNGISIDFIPFEFLHHKFLIFKNNNLKISENRSILITGSYNLTLAAENSNIENIIIINKDIPLQKGFRHQFKNLKKLQKENDYLIFTGLQEKEDFNKNNLCLTCHLCGGKLDMKFQNNSTEDILLELYPGYPGYEYRMRQCSSEYIIICTKCSTHPEIHRTKSITVSEDALALIECGSFTRTDNLDDEA